jgi:hypothetical protein
MKVFLNLLIGIPLFLIWVAWELPRMQARTRNDQARRAEKKRRRGY